MLIVAKNQLYALQLEQRKNADNNGDEPKLVNTLYNLQWLSSLKAIYTIKN